MTARSQTNSLLYLINRNGAQINKQGADEIALIDSVQFLYRIKDTIFLQSSDTIVRWTGKKFTHIEVLKPNFYLIEYKMDSDTVVQEVTNKYFETIAEAHFENAKFDSYNQLEVLAKYFWDREKLEYSLINYFDKKGKQFSDFKE